MNHSLSKNLLLEDKITFYNENGFVQIDNVLNLEEISELRTYLGEVMDENKGLSIQTDTKGGAYYKVLNQRVNTWRDHAGMARYVSHPRFANIALQLSNVSGVRLFHDHALLKMPGDSKPTPWHQDFPYWPLNRDTSKKTLSIWIALDDVDENNGCMMFLPKSNKVGQLKPINLVDPEDIFEYTKNSEIQDKTPVIVKMKAGSCTVHSGLTFHYAHANKTNKPRRALVIIYMPDGTTYSNKPHVITDPLNLAKDEKLQHGIFPLLASR
jgi:ectoine hydroxylase-related dioxygenase (phytanoyl-CoA dioxygenase family)